MIDLSLTLLKTSWWSYSIPKELKYTALFLSKNNVTQCVPLLFLSSRFTTYVQSFVLSKLTLEKTALNLGS